MVFQKNIKMIDVNAYIDAEPEKVLQEVFGYDAFRSLQKDCITHVLSGRDTLAVMPTGGGKSLTYQIPALIFKGITIVVSPLISLMQDQVTSLQENGITAVYLNSALDLDDYNEAVVAIKSGQVKLVYVSPEGLSSNRIQSVLHDEQVHVACITVDEAHCISSWGHDFRPDYLEIARIREQFSDAVCLALTATATRQVREDIIHNLGLRDPRVLIASFNRENIYLEVKPKTDAFVQVVDFLELHKDESGIIYCFSRKQVDQLTQHLMEHSYSVLPYHAGLSAEERSKNQDAFIKDRVSIIVATVAFGMGIDKPNVRFVIHYDMPKSVEEYYQEIGRAGRDGLPSHALLLYSAGDIHKIRYFFDDSVDREKSEKLLQGMISYAMSRVCRRRTLLAYFGEMLPDGMCSGCDVCTAGPIPEIDMTIPVQKFLSCMIRTGQRFGAAYVIDVLLGSRQQRIRDNRHTLLSTWGIGTELSKNDWFTLVSLLLERGYIRKSQEYSVLSLAPLGKEVLASHETIMLPIVLEGKKKSLEVAKPSFIVQKKDRVILNLDDSEACRIVDALKVWRKKLAEEKNVPPYVIMGDKTIIDLANKKPQTKSALLAIFGIGQVKADALGDQILRIIGNATE